MYINGKWFSETEVKAHVSELERKVSELEDKHWSECGQIARYEDENRKLKRLLGCAVRDIKYLIHCSDNGRACDRCKYGNEMYCYADDCGSHAKWEHADEALALIGEDTNFHAGVTDINVGDKNGWISCKERMPNNDRVLILVKNGSVYIAKHSDFGHYVVSFEFWVDDLDVTHWQPLPEPPEV